MVNEMLNGLGRRNEELLFKKSRWDFRRHFWERAPRNINKFKILKCKVKSNVENESSNVLDRSRGAGVGCPERQFEGFG